MASTSFDGTQRAGMRHILGRPVRYLAELTAGRIVLWCYLIWYMVVLVRYFDPSVRLWGTAAGLSLIIGTALLINTTRSGSKPVRLEPWPAVRLYLFPFCVSSFSALVKGRRFWLIFSPRWGELLLGTALCLGFWAVVAAAKAAARSERLDLSPGSGPPPRTPAE